MHKPGCHLTAMLLGLHYGVKPAYEAGQTLVIQFHCCCTHGALHDMTTPVPASLMPVSKMLTALVQVCSVQQPPLHFAPDFAEQQSCWSPLIWCAKAYTAILCEITGSTAAWTVLRNGLAECSRQCCSTAACTAVLDTGPPLHLFHGLRRTQDPAHQQELGGEATCDPARRADLSAPSCRLLHSS